MAPWIIPGSDYWRKCPNICTYAPAAFPDFIYDTAPRDIALAVNPIPRPKMTAKTSATASVIWAVGQYRDSRVKTAAKPA